VGLGGAKYERGGKAVFYLLSSSTKFYSMAIGLFIDAAYMYKVLRNTVPIDRQIRIDYKIFREFVESTLSDTIDEAYFFSADDDPPRATRMNSFLQVPYPQGPGFRVKVYWFSKRVLRWPASLGGMAVVHPEYPNIEYEQTSQKAVDVGLVYHMINSYHRRKWTKLALVAGDGDFHEPVQNLVEAHNVDVHLFGSLGTISGELKAFSRAIVPIDNAEINQMFLASLERPPQ